MNDEQIISNVFSDLCYTLSPHTDRVVRDYLIAVIPYARSAALREARDNYRPGDNNPWAVNVRKFLDYRANMIEGGE